MVEAVSKSVIQKTTEATDNLIDNKISERITKVSKISQRSLKINMTKEYLRKEIYLQKKDKKSLTI